MYKHLLNYILKFYINSIDFNGCRLHDLYKRFPNIKLLKISIIRLLQSKEIDLYYCDTNPYVKNFSLNIPRKKMIELIEALPETYNFNKYYKEISISDITIKVAEEQENDPLFPISLFPSSKVIKKYIKTKPKYLNLPPFNKMLMEGMPHLHFLYFRIDVLNRFLNDPRYTVHNYDYTGLIYYNFREDNNLEKDMHDIYLSHFGIAYNKITKENAITIFPHDLRRLSLKHQCYFYSYLLKCQNDYLPESDYYKNVMGESSDGISIFDAFIQEMVLINQMFKIICGQNLFTKIATFNNTSRPEYFHSFLAPTNITYCNFCRTLFRLVIDQLNKKAMLLFAKKLNIYYKEIENLGTMTLLQEIFNKGFQANNGEETGTKIINIWKTEIHESRNIQSHSFIEDKYDIKIYTKYRKTLQEAYISIRLIRLVLSEYPIIKKSIKDGNIVISDDLFYGKIKTYFIS